jgi:hypothetical protein
MKESLFWRLVVLGLIATGLYIGHGLHRSAGGPLPDPLFATAAHAGGVATVSEDTRFFITASEDGRKVFVWEFMGPRAPRFHAQGLGGQ